MDEGLSQLTELILGILRGTIFGTTFGTLSTYCVVFPVYRTILSLKVKKRYEQNNWILCQHTPDLSSQKYKPAVYAEFSKEDLQKLNNALNEMSYPTELTEIVEQFKNYVTPENFKTCLHNLQTVKINKITLKNDIKEYLTNRLSLYVKTGVYSPVNNTIDLYSTSKSTLSHEFLHMASTINYLNIGFSKFRLIDNKVFEIGRGINEGYTELLNNRIFGKKRIINYPNVKITRLFETFFDNPKDMENSYFHSNLDSLYQMFCEYGTKEEFFEIMNNLDVLTTTRIPIDTTVTSIRTQFKLYDIIKRSKNQDKISAFEQILDENPLTKLLKNGRQLVLANKPPKAIKTKKLALK